MFEFEYWFVTCQITNWNHLVEELIILVKFRQGSNIDSTEIIPGRERALISNELKSLQDQIGDLAFNNYRTYADAGRTTQDCTKIVSALKLYGKFYFVKRNETMIKFSYFKYDKNLSDFVKWEFNLFCFSSQTWVRSCARSLPKWRAFHRASSRSTRKGSPSPVNSIPYTRLSMQITRSGRSSLCLLWVFFFFNNS